MREKEDEEKEREGEANVSTTFAESKIYSPFSFPFDLSHLSLFFLLVFFFASFVPSSPSLSLSRSHSLFCSPFLSSSSLPRIFLPTSCSSRDAAGDFVHQGRASYDSEAVIFAASLPDCRTLSPSVLSRSSSSSLCATAGISHRRSALLVTAFSRQSLSGP